MANEGEEEMSAFTLRPSDDMDKLAYSAFLPKVPSPYKHTSRDISLV
jgi:hypothetical protein